MKRNNDFSYKIYKINNTNLFDQLNQIINIIKIQKQSHSLYDIFHKICVNSKKNNILPPKFLIFITDINIFSSTDPILSLIDNDLFYSPIRIEKKLQIFSEYGFEPPNIIIWNCKDNDSPFYNKSFNDAYHVVFIKGNYSDTIKYILYDMKNDVDKKHKVLSSINKYNIHFNNIYKPIKYFLKLIHNDNFVADNFLFNFKYQSFIINLLKIIIMIF